MYTATIIQRPAVTDVVAEAVAKVEAELNNVGLPSYNSLLLAMEKIKALSHNLTRKPDALRDEIHSVAAKALGE